MEERPGVPGVPDAEVILRTTRALADPGLRVAYLCALVRDSEIAGVARALDVVCHRAEQAELAAREVLVSLVDALNAPELREHVQRMREQAAGESLLALERIIRQPQETSLQAVRLANLPDPNQDRVPDYGRGRSLTLGERKTLAGRPDREMMARLLGDPHPEVIRRLLCNPKLTEDDVIRLASKRPCRPDVLAEIARSPRWIHRGRIRLAIVLNPDTPLDIASPIAGLLVRQELRLVSESTSVSPAVRALCLEHLARRPPGEFEENADSDVRRLQ
jgi:hypothetical protein